MIYKYTPKKILKLWTVYWWFRYNIACFRQLRNSNPNFGRNKIIIHSLQTSHQKEIIQKHILLCLSFFFKIKKRPLQASVISYYISNYPAIQV